MQLWLVRHAQPLVQSGVCYGVLDVAADPAASQTAAAELARTLPHGLHVQYSSLQRCEQLVLLLKGLRPDLTYKREPDLREMDFGQWEGQRWDAIAPQMLKAWTDDFENYRCGGTGESTGQFVRRVHGALQRTDQASVWITHAGVIRAVTWMRQRGWTALASETLGPSLGLSAAEWPQERLAFGQLQRVDWPDRPPTGYPAPR